MRKLVSSAIIILLLTFCLGCMNSYQHLSVEEAMDIMKTQTDYLIVDVRTKEEYEKRHIPNAVLVPIADIKDGKLDALPDKNQMLLIYCWTGRRAQDSAELLTKRGYTNVYEFGGLVNWTGEVEGEVGN